jgi:hypothetical protein
LIENIFREESNGIPGFKRMDKDLRKRG